MIRFLIQRWWIVTLLAVSGALPARADMLVLKDGRVLEGAFVAGSERFIQFRTSEGIQSIPLDQIGSLHFKPGGDSLAALSMPDSMSSHAPEGVAPPLAPGALLVPAGTQLSVRMEEDVTSSQKAGAAFHAVLDADLVVEGKVAAAKGSSVQGQIADVRGGKQLGTQYLKLTLTNLTVHNQKVPLVTGNFGPERGSGQSPRLVGVEQAVGGSGSPPDLEQFAKGKDHLKVPKGVVLVVSLRESVALFP